MQDYMKCKYTTVWAECVLPRSRGDSLLLLVLCGEAPCCKRVFTFSTRPAWAARVRAVSKSTVTSSRVSSLDAGNTHTDTHTQNTHAFAQAHLCHAPHPPHNNHTVGQAIVIFLLKPLTQKHLIQDVCQRQNSCPVKRQSAKAVCLSEGFPTAPQLSQCVHITCPEETQTNGCALYTVAVLTHNCFIL